MPKDPSTLTTGLAHRRRLILWSLVILAIFLSGLAGPALIDPDEGRNAEIAREMSETGDYIVPRLNGLPFLDKPLLYFASSALTMKLIGEGEVAARLPAFLCALALAAATAWFAAYLFGASAGWIAGIATLASPLLLAFSRIAIFDSMLSLFMILALIFFYRAIEAVHDPNRSSEAGPRIGTRTWTILAWAAMAGGVLTKGPVALAVPLLVVIPFAIWRKASRAIWHPLGPLTLLALVVPWLLAVQRQEPDFLHYALVVETWNRFTTDEMKRTGPLWYFLPYLIAGAAPWSIVAAVGWLRTRSRSAEIETSRVRWVFLHLWWALPLLLFSLSQSKRPQYILPVIPCLAILVAGLWSRSVNDTNHRALPGQRAGASVFLLAGAIFLSAGIFLDPVSLGVEPAVGSIAHWTVIALGFSCVVGGALGWRARTWTTALIALSLPTTAFPLVVGPLFQSVAEHRSTRQLAALIQDHPVEGASVAVLEKFPHSLPFYLGRTVTFASRDGTTLRSGYVERSFEQLLARPGTSLRTHAWWYDAVAACSPASIFVVPQRYTDDIAILEAAGRRKLGGDGRFLVFGSCGQSVGGKPSTTLEEMSPLNTDDGS